MRTRISFGTRIFVCALLTTLVTLSLPLYYARVSLHDDLLQQASQQALHEVRLIGRLIEIALPDGKNVQDVIARAGVPSASAASFWRLTLIAPDGRVLADSAVATEHNAQLDNHADRPEVRMALTAGEGVSTRYSTTLHSELVYAAYALDNGMVLRIAVPFAGLKDRTEATLAPLTGVVLGAGILSLLFALLFSYWLKRDLAQMVTIVEGISYCKYRRLHLYPGGEFTPLADAVNRMAQDIVRLERVRRDFVANVSHELRTPLTAIQGYAETLTALDNAPEDCRRFGEIIRKHGAYLGVMVEELLTLARLEAGDSADNACVLIPLRVEDIFAQAHTLCHSLLSAKKLHLECTIAPELTVMGNAGILTQVFRNLLENACRHAPTGSCICFEARKDHNKDDKVFFRVCDNGPGIPQAALPRIFERFYRVEKHRGGTPSTGLGLAICKHGVERQGGRIWVESPAHDCATALCFTLPITTLERTCES